MVACNSRTHRGKDPTVTKISGLSSIQGKVANPNLSSSLPYRVRFNVAVTTYAETFDTGFVTNDYPYGILTHLSSKHFQYAPAWHSYLNKIRSNL